MRARWVAPTGSKEREGAFRSPVSSVPPAKSGTASGKAAAKGVSYLSEKARSSTPDLAAVTTR